MCNHPAQQRSTEEEKESSGARWGIPPSCRASQPCLQVALTASSELEVWATVHLVLRSSGKI